MNTLKKRVTERAFNRLVDKVTARVVERLALRLDPAAALARVLEQVRDGDQVRVDGGDVVIHAPDQTLGAAMSRLQSYARRLPEDAGRLGLQMTVQRRPGVGRAKGGGWDGAVGFRVGKKGIDL